MPQLRLERVASVERPHSTADVIFVHGLGGNGKETWSAGADSFWPLWIFEDLKTVEVWTLEYPASMFGSSNGSLVIADQAKQVLDLLASHSIGSRPIVFVAHSLGGLLVKQLLRTALELKKQDWKAIASTTKGILFLATPHTGASIAGMASKFPLVSKATAQIAANDPYLMGLNDWYQQNAVDLGFLTHAYCETKAYMGQLIVDKASANPGVVGCVAIEFNGHHMEICKPSSRQSPIYIGARKFISDVLGTPLNPPSPIFFGKVHQDGQGGPSTDDDEVDLLADEIENYTTNKDEAEPRLDLAEKLRLGGREYEIPRAIRLKEEFAKSFARNQLQASAMRRYINLLAEVDSKFNAHVYPAIVNGATSAETAVLIKTWIRDPILSAHHHDDALVNHVVIDRMIYYLTGICHIRWAP